MQLQRGDFVRVKADTDFRPGQDGMVMEANRETVGLMFGYDRYGVLPAGITVTGLIEDWSVSDLDLTSVEGIPR